MKKVLNVDYDELKEYILNLLNENENSIMKTIDDILNLISNYETKDYDYLRLVFIIFSDLYKENIPAFTNLNGNKKFKDLNDIQYTIICEKINKVIEDDKRNNTNEIKNLFDNFLSKLSDSGYPDFLLIEGNESLGFNFNYILYIPAILKNNTLIFESSNSGPNPNEEELKSIYYIYRTLSSAGVFKIFTPLQTPMMILLLPRSNSKRESKDKEMYIQQLSRNTILNEDEKDPLYKLDAQVFNAIENAKKIVYERRGITLEEKTMLYGFSTSSKFAYRLAFLYPSKFCGVCAGGVGASLPLPLSNYNGVDLIYPTGTYDYKEITGREFDIDEYKKLPQFYFMGDSEPEERYNTILYSVLHDKCVQYAYINSLGRNMYERLEVYNELYKNLGFKNMFDESWIKRVENCGHDPRPMYRRCLEFTTNIINMNQIKNKELHKNI